jgi:XapX domain-containing protein
MGSSFSRRCAKHLLSALKLMFKTTELTMKAMLISFAVGLMVGVAYALLRVKSPAPPLVALIGLLGMVAGEHAIERFFAKKSDPHGASRDAQIDTTASTR